MEGGGRGRDKNQHANSGQKTTLYITINQVVCAKGLVLCTIFLKLTKYSYLHTYSTNIYKYYICKFKYISWSYK